MGSRKRIIAAAKAEMLPQSDAAPWKKHIEALSNARTGETTITDFFLSKQTSTKKACITDFFNAKPGAKKASGHKAGIPVRGKENRPIHHQRFLFFLRSLLHLPLGKHQQWTHN